MIRIRLEPVWAAVLGLALGLAVLSAGGCRSREKKAPGAAARPGKETGQSTSSPEPAPPATGGSTPVGGSFDTPEQTMNTYFEAARRKNLELYRACFMPDADGRLFAQRRFENSSRRIQAGEVAEVPMGINIISDTEAVVKISNNKKNRIRELKLRKVDGKWRIVPWKGVN